MSEVEHNRSNVSAKFEMPNLLPDQVLKLGQRRMEALMLAQKELIDTYERTNKDWCARAKLEASVASELATNMAAARTIPEAAAVYQEWMNRRMRMLAD